MRPFRIPLIGVAVIAVSLAHYLTPVGGHHTHDYHWLHAFFRWFYHLPVILAGFWFGLRGGVVCGLAVSLLYAPHVVFQWAGGSADQWLEMALYNVVGWVTGLLSDAQKRDRDRHRRAAEDLDRAYQKLKDQALLLLETEDHLRQAERLSALGELTAGLAHEIKTPLASIRGASEILGGEATADDRREFSGILLKEVERLTGVVNRFLEFARPRARGEVSAEVDRVVEQVLDLVNVEARRRSVSVTRILGSPGQRAAIEAEQLSQVVLNLVMNALQAMEGGGRLEVKTERRERWLGIVVTDTGPGIPEALRARMFDPFVTGRSGGTGLGLSIVRRILDNHGARIEIETADRGGTEIVVSLPFAEEAHE